MIEPSGYEHHTHMTPMHTAIYLLAALYHESTRQPVVEGKTLAHAVGKAMPFVEWPDLPPEVKDGRRLTATSLLRRFEIGEPIPDFGTNPVSEIDLAEAIHECEREAVERRLAVVKLDRPWIPFAALPELAREGRLLQARYLKARAFFVLRNRAEAT